jgi:hypothetical protein
VWWRPSSPRCRAGGARRLTGLVVYPLGSCSKRGSGFGNVALAGYAWLQTPLPAIGCPPSCRVRHDPRQRARAAACSSAAVRPRARLGARGGRGAVWWWVFGAPFDARPREAFIGGAVAADSRRGVR